MDYRFAPNASKRIGRGRLGAAEMNRVLVARNDGIDRRILPHALTLEAQLVFVIGESGRNVRSEEQRRDLTDHEPSPGQIRAGPANGEQQYSPSRGESGNRRARPRPE
jgi:hypothetical protein